MALKDLTADLENFKYGMSSPEQINNQIDKLGQGKLTDLLRGTHVWTN